MGLVHKIPHRIHELFVLAPDGMKNNRIRNFIAKTYLGRRIGSQLVKSPKTLHRMIHLLRMLQIISEKVENFFISNTNDIDKRYRIYHSWIALRNYELHPKLMNHYFHAKKIRVEFFIGKFDVIITPQSADLFLTKFNYQINLHELACGHDLLSLHSQIEKIILTSP